MLSPFSQVHSPVRLRRAGSRKLSWHLYKRQRWSEHERKLCRRRRPVLPDRIPRNRSTGVVLKKKHESHWERSRFPGVPADCSSVWQAVFDSRQQLNLFLSATISSPGHLLRPRTSPFGPSDSPARRTSPCIVPAVTERRHHIGRSYVELPVMY